MKEPFKIIDLGFSVIELFPNYLVNHSREGIVMDSDEINSLFVIFDSYYSNRKFGYISNRIQSYTVNPLIYKTENSHRNLAALAIVCYSKNCEQNIDYEQSFSNLSFNKFQDLQQAKKWMEDFFEDRKKAGL